MKIELSQQLSPLEGTPAELLLQANKAVMLALHSAITYNLALPTTLKQGAQRWGVNQTQMKAAFQALLGTKEISQEAKAIPAGELNEALRDAIERAWPGVTAESKTLMEESHSTED